MIVALSGKAGSGKDTLSQLLVKNHGFEHHKFADKLKVICSILTGLPTHYFVERAYYDVYIPLYKRTVREMLQTFATETCREHFDDLLWVKACLVDYSSDKNWVISDLRFQNEAEYLRQNYAAKLVRIEGSHIDYRSTHQSEVDLDHYSDFHYLWQCTDYTLDQMPLLAEVIAKL